MGVCRIAGVVGCIFGGIGGFEERERTGREMRSSEELGEVDGIEVRRLGSWTLSPGLSKLG